MSKSRDTKSAPVTPEPHKFSGTVAYLTSLANRVEAVASKMPDPNDALSANEAARWASAIRRTRSYGTAIARANNLIYNYWRPLEVLLVTRDILTAASHELRHKLDQEYKVTSHEQFKELAVAWMSHDGDKRSAYRRLNALMVGLHAIDHFLCLNPSCAMLTAAPALREVDYHYGETARATTEPRPTFLVCPHCNSPMCDRRDEDGLIIHAPSRIEAPRLDQHADTSALKAALSLATRNISPTTDVDNIDMLDVDRLIDIYENKIAQELKGIDGAVFFAEDLVTDGTLPTPARAATCVTQ